MVDWSRGGWTGSINRWTNREIRDQLRKNPLAQRSRYPLLHRSLRGAFGGSTFGAFLILYAGINLLTAAFEITFVSTFPNLIPSWRADLTATARELLGSVPEYLIGAQVGLLS